MALLTILKYKYIQKATLNRMKPDASNVEAFSYIHLSGVSDMNGFQKQCISYVPFYLSPGINRFIALVLVLFPWPILWILKIDRKQCRRRPKCLILFYANTYRCLDLRTLDRAVAFRGIGNPSMLHHSGCQVER